MKRLLLLDLSGLYWANWHATADQEASAAYERTIDRVHSLSSGYDHVAICCDHGPYWRKEIHPEYKAQRDAPAEMAIEQFRRVKERLTADGYLLWGCKGFEADDVIATAVRMAREAGDIDVTIASSDKDMLQLVGDDVRAMSLSTGHTLGVEEVIAKFGVHPKDMRGLLALVGDASDNVPGVPRVGPKNAARLLHEFGDVFNLLAKCDQVTPPSIREAVFSCGDGIRLAYELVGLRDDVPIEWAELFAERKPERLTEEEDMGSIDEEMDEPELESAPQSPAQEATETKLEPKSDALAKLNGNGNGHGVQVFEQGLQPGTLGAAYKLARGLYESRLYSRFPNAEAIWAVIIRGREMGLGALTALDNFHIVESKPVANAHLIIARAKSHPDCDYLQFVGGDATYAEAETKNRRAPKPTRLRYTLDQAKRAGLVRSGSNWEKRPEDMLNKTVMVKLARLEYPAATAGLYCDEEME